MRNSINLTIAIAVILVFLVAHKDVVPYLAQKYLKDFGISYSSVEGSLLDGITINDVTYEDKAHATLIQINYNFLSLLRPSPKIDKLLIQDLHVDINKFPKTKQNQSSFSLFGFEISKIELKNTHILYEDKKIHFNLKSSNLSYKNALHVDALALNDGTLYEKNTSANFNLFAQNITYDKMLHVGKMNINDAKIVETNRTISFSMFSENITYDKILHVGKMNINNAKIVETNRTISFSMLSENIAYDKTLYADKLVLTDAILSQNNQILKLDLNASKINYDTWAEAKNIAAVVDFTYDENQSITATIESSYMHYDQVLDAKNLKITADSSHAKGTMEGTIIANRLKASALLSLSDASSKKYLGEVKGVPEMLTLTLDATPDMLMLSTHLDKISPRMEENVTLNDADVTLKYFVKDKYLSAVLNYRVSYLDFGALSQQTLVVTPNGQYQSSVKVSSITAPMTLPFKDVTATLAGNLKYIVADINATGLNVSLQSNDYKHFQASAHGNKLSLSFLDTLPTALREDNVSFNTKASVNITPLLITGTIDAEDMYSNINGTFEFSKQSSLLKGTVNLKSKQKLLKEYRLERFIPLKFTLYDSKDVNVLNIDANALNLSLFKNGRDVNGWGNLNTNTFELDGTIGDDDTKSLTLSASLPSINTLLSDLNFKKPDTLLFYDAQADIHATLLLAANLEIKTRIELPWYAFQLDSQTTYAGVDSFIEARIFNKNIVIESYNIELLDHKFYCEKDSKLSLDANGTIVINEFWIYDNLLLDGFIDSQSMRGKLELKSDKFTYEGKEGNITAAANISVEFDSTGKQKFEGAITLLDGTVTYMPKKDYTITDGDIIIIQDIKENRELNRSINIHITSLKPISYKGKNIDLTFTPDITVFQEPKTLISLLGMVTINKGFIEGAGKKFNVNKSEVYFYGEDILNPYLNLDLRYTTLNYIDIAIFITNDVDSPVVIFSSNPTLNQNDIMSYLLFGEPSSSVFSGSGDGGSNTVAMSSLLLGTGLKSIFNEASAFKVDTLNILTNKEGTFGYEIGSRITKELRVIYKNDTISSVVVQYSLNKSTRVDVDVHESGGGVSIIYIKDF